MQESVQASFSGDAETAALKIPPHSIEAEQAVLGGIFMAGHVSGYPDYFYDDVSISGCFSCASLC